jgi:hypothetical protein
MISELFNIKFPNVVEDTTFETFKSECLKLQKSEPFRSKWFRHVDERYIIPLLVGNEKNLEILDRYSPSRNYFASFRRYRRRRMLRKHSTLQMQYFQNLKNNLPFHLRGFFAFEEIEKRFPMIIDINLRRIFKEKYRILLEEKGKDAQTVKLFKMLENNEVNVRVSFHDKDDTSIFIGTMIPDDYVFSPEKRELSVYFFKDINLGPTVAVKLFGSKVISTEYGTKTYQVLPQWEQEHKKRFTLRRNIKNNNKTYREVLEHDEDDPLIIKLKYHKTDPAGFRALVPVYKINDKTGDIINQLYKVAARISAKSILNPQKRKKRSKKNTETVPQDKSVDALPEVSELLKHNPQNFKEEEEKIDENDINVSSRIQVLSPPSETLSVSSTSSNMNYDDKSEHNILPPPVTFTEV